MPALPPVPNVLKVNFKSTRGSAQVANIIHILYSGTAPSNAQCDTLASDFLGDWGHGDGTHTWISLASPDNAIYECTVVDLTSPTSGMGEFAAAPDVGTRAGGELPASAATVLSWDYPFRHRGGHPRTYLPFGVDSDLNTPQDWKTSFTALVSEWAAGALGLILSETVGGTVLDSICGVSYILDGAHRVAPAVFPITQGGIVNRVCSQRRRLGKI